MKQHGKQMTLIVILLLLIVIMILALLYRHNVIPHQQYENKDFQIDRYISSVDYDQDHLDDQTDILQGARDYIGTNPKYKSKYYEKIGYPNDGYGVCTDVVAQALLAAGYDLRELVYQDVLAHPKDYDIDEADINIDFRRVKNLKVYFAHTAIELTTDVHKIEEWQGGDIVIFKKHIGIVSDKRNKHGVPFLIHHSGPYQVRYEQDVLEIRDDIVAHYRIS